MKNKMYKILGMVGFIAISALIGFSMIGCDFFNSLTKESHEHSYSSSWSSNATQHWKECDCGDRKDLGNHSGNTTGAACTTCGKSHEHAFANTWEASGMGKTWNKSPQQHWQKCSCGFEAAKEDHKDVYKYNDTKDWKECTVCGHTHLEMNHFFSTKYVYNASKHWKECVCGAKQNEADHTLSGTKCTTCDYDTTQPLNPFEGTWIDQSGSEYASNYIFNENKWGVGMMGIPAEIGDGYTFTYTSNKINLNIFYEGSNQTLLTFSYKFAEGCFLVFETDKYIYILKKDGVNSTHTGACQTVGGTGQAGGTVVYHNCAGFLATGTSPYIAYSIEAAPVNQGEGASLTWTTAIDHPYPVINDKAWGHAIGRGQHNTALILSGDSTAPAAKACADYKGGSKDDWFLPSTGELKEMFKFKVQLGISDDALWSSTLLNNAGNTVNGPIAGESFRVQFVEKPSPGGWNYEPGDSYGDSWYRAYPVRAVRYF